MKERGLNRGEIRKQKVIRCSKCLQASLRGFAHKSGDTVPAEGKLVLWVDMMWFYVLRCHAVMFQSHITCCAAWALLQLPAALLPLIWHCAHVSCVFSLPADLMCAAAFSGLEWKEMIHKKGKAYDKRNLGEKKKKWLSFSTDLSMPYCICLALPMNVGYLLCYYLFYCSTHSESF